MRLTKQLKAQVNSIKFASQIAATTDFMFNHHPSPSRDISPSDIPSPVSTSNNTTEETKIPLVVRPKVTFADSLKKFENNNHHHQQQQQRKVPTIITASQSDGCLNHEKHRLAIKRYHFNVDEEEYDDDSLNSNIFQDEQIML